jgi:RNA polymerase sigma-70 factor (ECF subfamily)
MTAIVPEAIEFPTAFRRARAGDHDAFAEIIEGHEAMVFSLAWNFFGDRGRAEEIAQDTFICAHRGLANFRGDSSLAAWLHCIALNLARNRYWYFRRRRRHLALPLDAVLGEDGTLTYEGLLACDSPGPVREAAAREFSAIVGDCMDRLPAGQREILMLRNVRQISYEHISRLLGINVGTVKSRVARARGNLRTLVSKAYPELTPEASPFECFEPLRPAGRLEAVCA